MPPLLLPRRSSERIALQQRLGGGHAVSCVEAARRAAGDREQPSSIDRRLSRSGRSRSPRAEQRVRREPGGHRGGRDDAGHDAGAGRPGNAFRQGAEHVVQAGVFDLRDFEAVAVFLLRIARLVFVPPSPGLDEVPPGFCPSRRGLYLDPLPRPGRASSGSSPARRSGTATPSRSGRPCGRPRFAGVNAPPGR